MKTGLAVLSAVFGLLGGMHVAGQSSARMDRSAQTNSPAAKDTLESPAKGTAIDVPSVKLEFKTQGTIPGAQSGMAFVQPVVCSEDGLPFIALINPSDLGPQQVYSLDPKGAHAFSVKNVPGLFDVSSLRSFFVTDSIVALFVTGTTDGTTSSKSVPTGGSNPQRAIYTGEHHDFLAEFDKNGNYKRTIKLPALYRFWRLQGTGDGGILALAYDRANGAVRLLLLDADGSIVRTLAIPSDTQNNPELEGGQSAEIQKQVQAESSLSWWLFSSARGKTVLYQARSKAPVLEIGSGGSIREVSVESPPGYMLDGMVPANDRWVFRFRRENIADGKEMDAKPAAKNYLLYEVDWTDGHLKRQIDVPTGPFYSIACEHDGLFIAFSMDDEKLGLLTADLPR